MEIKRADVDKVALLARLDLSDDEKTRLSADLSQILTYVEMLSRLDTDDVAPMSQVLAEGDHPSALREDRTRTGLAHDDIVSPAPDADGTFLKVPKVLDR